MRRDILALGAAFLVALTTVGCATTPRGEAESGETMIHVENNNPLMVNVEVLSGGQDYNVGQVETAATETFEMPEMANTFDLQIRVEPIGSLESYVSDELPFAPGDVINVEVEADLDLTTVTLR